MHSNDDEKECTLLARRHGTKNHPPNTPIAVILHNAGVHAPLVGKYIQVEYFSLKSSLRCAVDDVKDGNNRRRTLQHYFTL